MKRFRDIDPLFQFLGIGLVMFLAAGLIDPINDERTIEVTRDDLETYLASGGGEALNSIAREAGAAPLLDRLNAEQKRALVQAYAEEQALYREARDWGLDEGDLVIRRRLGQSLKFAIRPEPAADPGDAELLRFYGENTANYRIPARLSFEHVFFSAEKRSWAGALRTAETLSKAPLEDWRSVGDRFAFQRSYANAGPAIIDAQLGEDFRKAVDKLPVRADQWQGPVRSNRGYHLVRMAGREAAMTENFATVREVVLDDWRRAQQNKELDRAVAAILAHYDTQVSEDVLTVKSR